MGAIKRNWKLILVIASAVVALILLFVIIGQTSQNKAFRLEDMIDTAKADVSIQEKRQVDLIYKQMADCVVQYDKHEAEVFKEIAESGNSGTIENVQTSIHNLVKKYPEMKSQENYKQLMTELSISANAIANYRENYNKQVREYNNHVRSFPNRWLLGMVGYQVKEYKQLEFEGVTEIPDSLFGNS